MDSDQKSFAIEIMRKSLNMHKSHFDAAKYVSDQFNSKYGGRWCVILNPRGFGNSAYTYYDICTITFNMGEFHVTIFKSNFGDESIRLSDKGNYNKVDVLTNKMNNNQKNFAIETMRKSLNMHKSHFESAKYVKNQFDSKYGGSWCVILNPRSFGDSSYTYFGDCSITFNMGEFYVTIFKSSLN